MKPINVVIADDHAVLRQGLRALLAEGAEFAVVGEAATGSQAVEQAAALAPDIVLMDLTMPELNGMDATRTIRARQPQTQVVILSTHADAEYLYRAFEAGANGYLLKDSAIDEIRAAIRAVHLGRRYVCAAMEAFAADLDAGTRESPLERLSARERQVLQLVVEGHTSARIAEMVHLSPKSVETYRSRLMKKLGVADTVALVKFAIAHGITGTR